MNRDIISNFSLFIIFLKLQICYPGASWVTFDAPVWLDKDPYGIHLTNRFHVAVRLFSNRSQMTSKCGKNKKVAHEAIAECVTDILTTFSRPL